MIECSSLLALTIIADYIFADPKNKFHPVRFIGNIIQYIETVLIRIGFTNFLGGITLLTLSLTVVLSLIFILYFISLKTLYPLHFILLLFLFYSSIGFRSLILYANEITTKLRNNKLELARATLSNIVGRDVTGLDQTGIATAAIESVSENFVDGILSPIFWFLAGCFVGHYFTLHLIFGITFVYLFRVTNTLDSMVGYKNKKYEMFGKASARFDDLLNFIPARLSILIIPLSAFFLGMDAKSSLRISLRDRLKHTSPNAAHPESSVAGALNIRLGGPTQYSSRIVKKQWLGEEFNEATINDIISATKLINVASIISTVLGITLFLLWGFLNGF